MHAHNGQTIYVLSSTATYERDSIRSEQKYLFVSKV
jgi:hypothetical protein